MMLATSTPKRIEPGPLTTIWSRPDPAEQRPGGETPCSFLPTGASTSRTLQQMFSAYLTSKVVRNALNRPLDDSANQETGTLIRLPSNALEHVLAMLPRHHILRLASSCRTLLDASADDGLWARLCLAKWGQGPEALAQFRVNSFKALHLLLSLYAPLQGCWQLLQDFPFGSLMVLRFDQGLLVRSSGFAPQFTEVAECVHGEPERAAAPRTFCIEFSHAMEGDAAREKAEEEEEEEDGSGMWGGGAPTASTARGDAAAEGDGEVLCAKAWVFRHRNRNRNGNEAVGTSGLARVLATPTQRVPVYGPLQYHFSHLDAAGNSVFGEWLRSEIGVLEVSWGGSIEDGLSGLWWPPPTEAERGGAGAAVERAIGVHSRVVEQTVEWAEAHHSEEETACPLLTLLPLPTILPEHSHRRLLEAVEPAAFAELPLPGLYSGDYGAQYGLRRHEVVMLQYLRGPREAGEQLAGERLGGRDQGEEAWWMVGYKCTGDLHVPMGRCSFRVCVDQGSRAVARDGEAGQPCPEDAVVAVWDGTAQVAFPGHVRPSWLPGQLTHYASGTISFYWSHLHQSTVFYRPLPLSSDMFLGDDIALASLSGGDQTLLRRAANLHVPMPEQRIDSDEEVEA